MSQRWSALTPLMAAMMAILAFGADAAERTSIRIGYAISMTGPNALGATLTSLANYRLWAHDVNAAGGLRLSALGKRLPVEVIAYDDHSDLQEAVKAVEHLIEVDKVDFVLAPWGTKLNIAVAPILNRAGYPHITAVAAPPVTELGLASADDLGRRWPATFWMLATGVENGRALTELLVSLRAAGKIGATVAMLSVADTFGIDAAAAARDEFESNGFRVVYDRAYPLGTGAMVPIMKEIAALAPDVFVAFSYPADTMMITDAARTLSFNPRVFYTAVGTAFPMFRNYFGADIEGVMGIGGSDAASPAIQRYLKHHQEVTGKEPDRWASPLTYASLQILGQAIERVGRIDRAAVIAAMQTGSFDTVVGRVRFDHNRFRGGWQVGQWQNGEFYGIAPGSLRGAHPPIAPKPPWRHKGVPGQ